MGALVAAGRADEHLLEAYAAEQRAGDLRRSPLTEHLDGPPPRAGDPIEPFLEQHGTRLRLRDQRFHLLLGAAVRPDWLGGKFAERYGDLVVPHLLPAFSGLALVRPDGFVSFRARSLDMKPLLRHLTRRLHLDPTGPAPAR